MDYRLFKDSLNVENYLSFLEKKMPLPSADSGHSTIFYQLRVEDGRALKDVIEYVICVTRVKLGVNITIPWTVLNLQKREDSCCLNTVTQDQIH